MTRIAITMTCLVLLAGCKMPWDGPEAPAAPAAPAAPGIEMPPGGGDVGGGFGNLDPGITGAGSGGAVEARAPARPRARPIQLAQASPPPDDLPDLEDIPAGASRGGPDELGDFDIDLDAADYAPPSPPRGRNRLREPVYDRPVRDGRPDRIHRRDRFDDDFDRGRERRGRDRDGYRDRDRGGDMHDRRRGRQDADRRGRRDRYDDSVADSRRERRRNRDRGHDHHGVG